MKLIRLFFLTSLFSLSSCQDNPASMTEEKGELQGTIKFPSETYGATLEIKSQGKVDSVGVGYGGTAVYSQSYGDNTFRFFIVDTVPIPSKLPLRVFVADKSAVTESMLIEVADGSGKISVLGTKVPLSY